VARAATGIEREGLQMGLLDKARSTSLFLLAVGGNQARTAIFLSTACLLVLAVAGCAPDPGEPFACTQVQDDPGAEQTDKISLNPPQIAAGSPGARVTISLVAPNPDFFYASNTILWNGSAAGIETTYVDPSHLIMGVPADLLAAPGTAQVVVQGTCAQVGTTHSAPATFTITSTPNPLTIATPSPLPAGTVGAPYSQPLAAIGGTPPYTWSLASLPGTLPPGLSLGTGGVLSGAPSAAGTFTFVVQAMDSTPTGANAASQSFSLEVVTQALAIQTSSLPGATRGMAYSTSLQAQGGTPPYDWSVISGDLPAGVSLSSGGILNGTPVASGSFNFSVQVTDASSPALSDTRSLSLDVAASNGVGYSGSGLLLLSSQPISQLTPPIVAMDAGADTLVVVSTSSDPNYSGSATVYAKDGAGNWASNSALSPLSSASNAAISADGSVIAFTVPACGSFGIPNCIQVLQRPANGWLQGPVWGASFALFQANPQPGDNFGASIAIDDNGDTIVVGAPCGSSASCGSAYVFTRPSCGTWTNCQGSNGSGTETARLSVTVDSGGVLEPVPTLGFSVAIDGSGRTIVAGAPDLALSTTPGSAYRFQMPAAGWGSAAAAATKLAASDGNVGDAFGWSVAVSPDASTVVVGAPKNPESGAPPDGPGAAYVFAPAGGWPSNGVLPEDAKLKASSGRNNDGFGESVAVTNGGSTIAVGAPNNPFGSGQPGPGAVYVYRLPASAPWSGGAQQPAVESQVLTAYPGAMFGQQSVPPQSGFGATNGLCMASDGTTIAVGGITSDPQGNLPPIPYEVVYLFY